MKTFERVCIEDYKRAGYSDTSVTPVLLKKGKTYLTSKEDNGTVQVQVTMVFGSFWFAAPIEVFGESKEFTP